MQPSQWSQWKKLSLVLACLFLLADTAGAQVFSRSSVYSAQLEVEDRQSGTLASAQREGLAQVVIKATGRDDSVANELVEAALKRPSRYLLGYSYEATGGALQLRVDYDERVVQELLAEAGLPLWTSNRPTVLAWLVLNEETRSFASSERAPEAVAQLSRSFERRGVPLQQPLYDLEDARAISPGEAWRQDSSALFAASRRYGDVLLLAGRVAQLSNGTVSGDWRFLDQTQWRTVSLRANSLAEFADAGAALVAGSLADRYAVVQDSGYGDSGFELSLRGVRSFQDFRAVRDALSSMEAVSYVVPRNLQGDLLVLRLEAEADASRFERILELDKRFVPIPNGDGLGATAYEWIP